MRILGLEITRARAEQEKALSGYIPGGGWVSLIRESFAGAWQRNVEVKTADVLEHPTAFRCISLISSDIAKLRIKLVRKVGRIWQETTSPAFSPVLRKPNRFQTRIQFVSSWVESKLIHGNAYVFKEMDARGVVRALYVLDPRFTRPWVSPDGEVFYQVAADNLSGIDEQSMIPATDIIHDRWNTYFHPLMGLSPITACGLAAVQGQRISVNSANFFGNQSIPGGIISTPGALTEEQAERIKHAWQTRTSGDNVGKLVVLGSGSTYTPLTLTAQDSQLIEQLRWSAETVAGCFGVPKYKVGIGEPPNFNNVAALNDQYYTQALQIHIESIESVLDQGMALPLEMGVQFDLDALLRMDPMAKITAAKEAVGSGLWEINEARERFDMPPIEGGDSAYLQQQNFSLAALKRRDEQAFTEPPQAPAEPETPDEDPEGPEDPETPDQARARLVRVLEDAARYYDARTAA